jgi:hypothetical protein
MKEFQLNFKLKPTAVQLYNLLILKTKKRFPF